MALKYIKQRGENDCGIAALAMACRLRYETVAADLPLDGTEGLNDTLVKDWLYRNGWAWQERTPNIWRGGKYEKVHPWPPSPFAPTHICFVEATKGWHFCVLDFDGLVYDPWKQDRNRLDHPDYKRVGSVLGLFRTRYNHQHAGDGV